MRLKAEIAVDERFKVREESMKMWFDTRLTKLVAGDQKGMELGREVCAMKLQTMNLKKLS